MNERFFENPYAARVSLGLALMNCTLPVYLYTKTNALVFIISWLVTFGLFALYKESSVFAKYNSSYRTKVFLLTLTPTFALYSKLILKMNEYDKFTEPLLVIGILSLSIYIFYAFRTSKKAFEANLGSE